MTVLEIKAAVRKRDGYACTRCGMNRAQHFAHYERDLDVHRVTPGSEYTMEGCITVCRSCHGPLPKCDYNSDPRAGVNLNVWLPKELMEVFESLRRKDLRSKKDQVIIILRDYFSRRGVRLPPGQQESE